MVPPLPLFLGYLQRVSVMSKPFEYCSASSVVTEILSGCSALHMEPKPLENPDGTFLSDTDYWVQHSIEHFHKAVEHSGKVTSAFERLLHLAEMVVYKHYKDEYSFDWDKMTDIERGNTICGILAKKLNDK